MLSKSDPLFEALRSGAIRERPPMYVAVESGVIDDEGRALVITKDQTRVAQEVVDRLGEAGSRFFDFGVRVSSIRPGARCGYSGLAGQVR